MKLKYKMTLIFVCLYLLSLLTINYLVSRNTYTNLVESEIKGNLNIEESIYLNLSFSLLYEDMDSSSKKNTEKFFNNFCSRLGNKNIIVSISDWYDNDISSNSTIHMDPSFSELKSLRSKERSYILKHLDDSFYLFIYRKFSYNDKLYFLKTTRDISFIDYISHKNSSIFLNISLIVTLFVVTLTLIFSHFLTQPIWKLIETSKNISKGNFSDRINITNRSSSNEIANLSGRFNEMVDIIEDKISSLETENMRKETFINNLSHELRTPLTSIIGFSSLLKDTPYKKESFDKSLNYINSEGKRILNTSNLLLKLARIKEDKIELSYASSIELLNEIKEVSSVKYFSIGATIELDHNSRDFHFNMNPDLIKLCIHNFIENGINSSKKLPKIIIGTCTYNEETCFYVKDFGIGMNSDEMKFIFDPFYRVDKSRSRLNGGTGLGLSICQAVAAAHNGSIYVDSSLGDGSTFYISLNETR